MKSLLFPVYTTTTDSRSVIGQFPTFFSAAVLRNPVISGGDITNTDIPDWYFSEFGHAYPLASSEPGIYPLTHNALPPPPLLDGASFSQLQAASPISHVDSMTVPVLLLIGTSDRRVAPSQGIGLYHALKARYASMEPKGRVDMLMFEGEGHSAGWRRGAACVVRSRPGLVRSCEGLNA